MCHTPKPIPRKGLALAAFALASAPLVRADIKLPAIFGDHMVFQQMTDAAIWGWADPGENVVLATDWSEETVSSTADENGRWLVRVVFYGAKGR